MVDKSLSFEGTVGAKWVSVFWPIDADKPNIRWRLLPNGIPNSHVGLDVMAGARRVRVFWPHGAYEAKVEYWNYLADENKAESFLTKEWITSEEGIDSI